MEHIDHTRNRRGVFDGQRYYIQWILSNKNLNRLHFDRSTCVCDTFKFQDSASIKVNGFSMNEKSALKDLTSLGILIRALQDIKKSLLIY